MCSILTGSDLPKKEKMRFVRPIFITIILILGTISRGQGSDAYDPEASITGLYTGPYFDPLAPRNLTAHLGDRAELPCTVRQLGDKSVSWVRMRDADILTVDRYTFVGDERFEAHYSVPAETWNLIINYAQERDAGDYECQVSTEPKMSQFFNLRVVVPQVNIDPPGDRHVKAGSQVRIDCHITDVVQIPDYIFWYHDNVRVLDRTDKNLDFTVERTGEESIKSSLHIERVRKDQSGNYTCMPSNLHAAYTLLHVLNEEHPAAMQDGRNSTLPQRHSQGLMALLLCILFCIFFDLNDHTDTSSKTYDLDDTTQIDSFDENDLVATTNNIKIDSIDTSAVIVTNHFTENEDNLNSIMNCKINFNFQQINTNEINYYNFTDVNADQRVISFSFNSFQNLSFGSRKNSNQKLLSNVESRCNLS